MTRSLRSGQSLASSLHQASITEPCDLLIRIAAAMNNGQSLNQACNDLIEADEKQHTSGDLSVVLHVISLASEVGGDAAHHIDALIDTLLDRSHARQDRQAQASTAMASTRLITWLPVVCAAWIVSDSPAIRNTMLATPLGWTCLTLGVGLNLVGRIWTKKLINS
ncbi:MAG: type II secretion system F family protein [Ilumatobacteraceae bacterium]|nr:type II secretion system F family protein [Ilumatobacteraceae bacterium]